jgi:hypothetical protein
VLVALRDIRVSETLLSDPRPPAIAADDTADAIPFYRLPAGVVAQIAAHE